VLFRFFACRHRGATSIAAWVNTGLPLDACPRGQFKADATLRRNLPLLALASVAMGIGLYAAAWALQPYVADEHILIRVIVIATLVVIGLVLFLIFCQITGAVDFRRHLATLRGRGRPPPAS
jgi:putative peptidoglycan lipid II flippase